MAESAPALRILIGHLGEPDPNSGASGTNYAVAQALRAAGHEVTELWQRDIPRHIAHHALYYAAEAPYAIERVVEQHLRARPFDIVDFSQPHAYRAARTVARRYPGTRFVHFSHGFEGLVEQVHRQYALTEPPRSRWRRLGSVVLGSKLRAHQRAIARWAHGHVVSSSACGDYLQQKLAVPAQRIAVLPQAPSSAFLETPIEPAARRPGVLYVGQFAAIKAPEVVAEVYQRLAQQGARLAWVCDPRHHAQMRELLGAAAHRVELLGWMEQSQLARLMDEFSVLLFPSYFEGYGKAFIEAMARGLCVVGTRVGGMRDQIESGVNGWLAEPGDVAALADACTQLLSAPAMAEAMGGRARQLAMQCTWAHHVERRVAFYRQLLASPVHAS